MNLKRLLWTSLLALTLASCGGGGGSPAAPPVGGIKYLNGDGQVTLSWQPTSGIYYWLWFVQGNTNFSITDPGLGVNKPSGGSPNIYPDYVMGPATNGYWFSYAVNAHAGNPTGPGGPQSNVVVATPRWAGAAWKACNAGVSAANYPTASVSGTPARPSSNCPSTNDTLNAVTFGANGTGSTSYPGWPIRWFLAAGDNGALYASSIGVLGSNIPATPVSNTNGSYNATSGLGNWFPLSNASGSNKIFSCAGSYNLNGAAYGWNTFVVVGDHGTICFSSTSTAQSTTPIGLTNVDDPTTANWYVPDYYYSTYGVTSSQHTWTNLQLPTNNLRAVATNQTLWNAGSGSFVAVGDGGTILFSGDGKTWSNTAVATASIGNATLHFTIPSTNTQNLNAVAYNSCGYSTVSANGVAPWTWIAVGDAGTMMFNNDTGGATNWYTGASGGIVTLPSSSSKLRGIACSPNATPGYGQIGYSDIIPVWVMVGDDGSSHGMLWVSYDGLNWTTPSAFTYGGITYPGFTINGSAATQFPETSMTSVTYGTRFVATGASGKIYVSVDGVTWNSTSGTIPNHPACVGSTSDPYCLNSQPNVITNSNTALDQATYNTGSGVSVQLNAVAHVPGSLVPAGNYGYVPFGYIAVGAGGAVTFSQ